MLLKILIWGVIGYIVYSWFKERMALKEGNGDRTVHHHHYHKEKKEKPSDDDYVDFEELPKK